MVTSTAGRGADTARRRPFAVLLDIDGAGSHPAAWRTEGRAPIDVLAGRTLSDAVSAAERAGFTAATFEDHPLPASSPAGVPSRVDAVVRAAFAAPQTGALGLVPVVAAALYDEPFHLGTQLASLDEASRGRAGVILRPDRDRAIAARYGRKPLADGEADDELADVVEVLRRLWDSWEEGAVIRDAASGRYLDRDRLHYAAFVGRRFSVVGPAITPRPPQGQPLVIGPQGTRAEVDAVVLAVSAAGAEAVDAAAEAAADVRRGHPAAKRTLLELEVVLDHAGLTGAARLEALDARAAWDSGRARYVGDAAGLAALLGRLAQHVDGVRLFPAVLGADLDELGRAVLPLLRAAGVHRPPRAGDTLRASWGLPLPANRFLEVKR